MKKIIVLVVALFLVAGVAYAKEEYKKKAGDYNVTITLEKAPSVGQNDVTVNIKDAQGKDVTDANVVVEYSMPPMPGMGAMNYKAKAEPKGGSYHARLNLSMAGAWTVNAKITKGGKTQSAKINIDAR
jgi:hypothetical protein